MSFKTFETQLDFLAESTIKTETHTEVVEREIEAQQVKKVLKEAKKQTYCRLDPVKKCRLAYTNGQKAAKRSFCAANTVRHLTSD